MTIQLPAQLQPIANNAGPWSRPWYEWAWRVTAAVNAGGGGGGGVPTSRVIATTAPLAGGGDLTADRTLTVATFGSGASGVVPASGGGTTNFLRADGTWTAPPSGGAAATVYLDFGATAGPRLTATVVDATVTPASIVLVSWGAVQVGDDNDPELDDITFFATPGTGSFDVTATCANNFSGFCRINYSVF